MKYFFLIPSSFFGLGYSPIASGTVGSLGAIPLCILFMQLSVQWQIALLLFSIPIASYFCHHAGKYLKQVDASQIVLDEVVGMLFSLFLIAPTLPNLLAGFLIFRFFDILKPFPAGFIDRNVKNGFGVVLDDVVAGIYTNCVLQIVLYFF